MILISGSEDTGFEATIKMCANSEPLEIDLDFGGEKEDISHEEFTIKVNNKIFPLFVEDELVKLHPSSIALEPGLYPFAIRMDKKTILSGYIEWADDDN